MFEGTNSCCNDDRSGHESLICLVWPKGGQSTTLTLNILGPPKLRNLLLYFSKVECSGYLVNPFQIISGPW